MPASPSEGFWAPRLLVVLLLLAYTAPSQCRTTLAAGNFQSAQSQFSSSSSLRATQQNILSRMNNYRSMHGAAPLWWSKKLTDSADSWARRCVFKHSHWGYGENLAWNYANWNDAIDAWYNEVKLYDYSRAQWSPSYGHFTQIVWKGTTAVGCSWSCQIYVCQYDPPGNVIGNFAQNVGRKKN